MNTGLALELQAAVHENIEITTKFCTEAVHRINDSEWDYLEAGNDWYKVCTQGVMQSPLVIDSNNTVRIGVLGGSYYPFRFNYPRTEYPGSFIDKHFQVLYNRGVAEYVAVDGNVKRLETQRIEVHAPAEHIIKGKQKALELHIVHKQQGTGDMMIIAVLFKISAQHNEFVQDLIDGEPIDVAGIVGERPEVLVYCGSLTYPPCTETVLWGVLANSQKISYEQVKYFSSKWENNQAFARGNGNNRSVQPLGSRVIFQYS